MSDKLEIKLVKSKIGLKKKQLAVIKALGLKKIGNSVIKENDASVNGMLRLICHIVRIKKV